MAESERLVPRTMFHITGTPICCSEVADTKGSTNCGWLYNVAPDTACFTFSVTPDMPCFTLQ